MSLLSFCRRSVSAFKPAGGPVDDRSKLLEQRELLKQEMLQSETPHLVNAKLNDLEFELGMDELYSFPTSVDLCMTSVCNAKCSFCDYSAKPKELRDHLSLEEFRRISWLKYVTTLNWNSGYSDSLANPHFGDIYAYAKDEHPHLNNTLVTNGIGLTDDLCEGLVGHLSELLISLNSPRPDTWKSLMGCGGFDRVAKMVSHITHLKRARNASTPRITMSMILFRDTIDEALEFVEFAHAIGAERVKFAHYLSTALVGTRKMPGTASLCHDTAVSDSTMEAASRKAAELGLEFVQPLPFSSEAGGIFMGERVGEPPQDCRQPWRNCSLSCLPGPDRHREMVFCCFGTFYRIKYSKSNLSEKTFQNDVWNHPAARYFRRTINGRGFNPICSACGTVDRFNPENAAYFEELYRTIDRVFANHDGLSAEDIEKLFEESNGGAHVSGRTLPEATGTETIGRRRLCSER